MAAEIKKRLQKWRGDLLIPHPTAPPRLGDRDLKDEDLWRDDEVPPRSVLTIAIDRILSLLAILLPWK